MSTWVLIGMGANQLEVPAMVWGSYDAAITKCKELFGNDFEAKLEYDVDKKEVRQIYKHYYDGCGGCYSVILKEVEDGQPFVRWDLD